MRRRRLLSRFMVWREHITGLGEVEWVIWRYRRGSRYTSGLTDRDCLIITPGTVIRTNFQFVRSSRFLHCVWARWEGSLASSGERCEGGFRILLSDGGDMRLNSPIGSGEAKKKSGKRGGGVALKKSARRDSPVALLSEHFPVEESSVSFVFYNGTAGQVFLAGTFNGWEPAGTAMQRGTDGIWRADLVLKPGTYEYRFVVDGVWQEDPISERFVANPFGGLNSVLVVKG